MPVCPSLGGVLGGLLGTMLFFLSAQQAAVRATLRRTDPATRNNKVETYGGLGVSEGSIPWGPYYQKEVRGRLAARLVTALLLRLHHARYF